VEVVMNSTPGYEPAVDFSTISKNSKGINIEFEPSNKTIAPIFGTSTIPMVISVDGSADPGPRHIQIMTNSTFPPQEFLKIGDIEVPSENVTSLTGVIINVKEKNWLDVFEMISNKLGGFTQLIIGIITFLAGIGIFKIKESKKKNKNKKKNLD
jgi:hypothetical protein